MRSTYVAALSLALASTALAAKVLRLLKSTRQIKALNRTFGSLFVAAGALLALLKRA